VQPLRIAVTGVPGSGKTSFCNHLNFEVLNVLDLAKKYSAIVDEGKNITPVEIDIMGLRKTLSKIWKISSEKIIFVDGHLSHNLPVDCVILMRCRPDILEIRLKNRNWSEEKISENVEFELLSAIINELDENIPTLEIDATFSTISEIWVEVEEWLEGERKTQMLEIDWIGELH
tara:strand:- start:865 stop:1386 length:522 start_codon:yes stop_codon:yes gene_type:complete